jgi:hypothetical protein
MKDEEYNDLKLRMTIVPGQVRWPAEHVHWQRLHQVVNEARERVSKAYAQLDEIDLNADLSREGKQCQRRKAAARAIADFEASRTLACAREAVELAVAKHDISPQARDATLKAMKEAEAGWQRAINKIRERASVTRPWNYKPAAIGGWPA